MVCCRWFASQLCRGDGSIDARLLAQPGPFTSFDETNVLGGHGFSAQLLQQAELVPSVDEMEYSYEGSLIASHYQASDIVYRMNYRDALSRLPILLRHDHSPDHLGMFGTGVRECPT